MGCAARRERWRTHPVATDHSASVSRARTWPCPRMFGPIPGHFTEPAHESGGLSRQKATERVDAPPSLWGEPIKITTSRTECYATALPTVQLPPLHRSKLALFPGLRYRAHAPYS